MPRYDMTIHRSARRELDSLTSANRDALTDTIEEVAGRESPTTHEKVRPLEGQDGLFRVRVGEVRAVCVLVKPELRILRVGHRSNVYDVIDELGERREAPA